MSIASFFSTEWSDMVTPVYLWLLWTLTKGLLTEVVWTRGTRDVLIISLRNVVRRYKLSTWLRDAVVYALVGIEGYPKVMFKSSE